MIKLDSDFIKMQGYANKIFDSLPIVKEFKVNIYRIRMKEIL